MPSAIASGDFTAVGEVDAVNGVYTLNGTPCLISDIFNLAHPDSNFNPMTDIDAGGMKPHNNNETDAYLKDPLLSQVLAGYTAVLEVTLADGTLAGSIVNIFAADPDYNVSPGVQMQWSGDPALDRIRLMATTSGGNFDNHNNLIQAAGIHKLAVTATDAKLVVSLDGGSIITLAGPGIDETMTQLFFNIAGGNNEGDPPGARVRSFAFYDIVDDADLPSLSAL